jgi:membrane-associated protease RseP (regulator of RpoE activity)
LPDPSDAGARLTVLTTLDQRVARVSQRLLEANADLCPVVRRSAGWALHSARQYSEELRPLAEGRFGLEGDLPGVLAAPPGSAAAAAGVRQGDLIVTVDGEPLGIGDGEQRPEFEGLATNIRRIDAALATGSARLTLRRRDSLKEVVVTPHRACGYEVQLNPSDELNARADGRRLFISTALAGFTQSDDELAVILGHELAHHVLGHRSWNDAGGLGRAVNPAAGVSEGGPGNAEQQADRVGLYLAARAGYDPAVAAPFWRRFGESNWRVRYPQLGHAAAGTRARNLEAVAAEIAVQQAAGSDLRP